MSLDIITLEVVRNRLEAIAQEMQNTLIRSAFSVTLKEGADCSCAIFSPIGDIVAQATANVGHLAVFVPAMERILQDFPLPSLDEGDVIIVNDPYAGGTHMPDIIIVVPIFHEGEVVSFGCSLGHMIDVGGRAPGSMASDSTEIYQEGLAIPPTKLYDAGKPNQTLFSIMERNIRAPKLVFGDMMALVAAGRTAARRISEVIGHYGVETYKSVIPALLDNSEKLTREGIEKIPDGVYEFIDYVDNDGIDLDKSIAITVRIEIAGSNITFDFSDSGPQVKGPANCGPGAILAPAHFVVRAITGSQIPSNSGCFRPITIKTPRRSIIASERPAPVAYRYHTLKRVVDTVLGALAPALSGRIPAAPHGSDHCASWGIVDPVTGERDVFMDVITGGSGAGIDRDGVDHLSCDLGNSTNIPAEAVELEYPIRVWSHNQRADSGGAGKYRGGLGVERELELLTGEVLISTRSDRHASQPWGLGGGKPGRRWISAVRRAGGEIEIVHGRATIEMKAGDRLVVLSGGGGGYGSPYEREVEKVVADVRDGKVSSKSAREDYGVVIDAAGKVDREATARLRRESAKPGANSFEVARGTFGLAPSLTAA